MSTFEPCPYCQAQQAAKVRFTPWGGVIGPSLLSLVKCEPCGKHFNGRLGTRVERAIRLYTTVSLAVLALLAALIIHSFCAGDKPAMSAPVRGAQSAQVTVVQMDAAV